MTTADESLRIALERLGQGDDLTVEQSSQAFGAVIAGLGDEARIAALLAALRIKGETVAELLGAVQAVRAAMLPFPRPARVGPLLDTCGTGGDGSRSVNISTAAALVAAACGVAVAKHGNRSATGNSGSADVLGELGVLADVPPDVAARCLEQIGICFLFAPRHHAGARHAAAVRRRLPFPTIWNLVGPLANPAGPEFQLLGVPNEVQAELMAQALVELGTRRAALVTGGDGLDEITLDGPTWVRWVEGGLIDLETWEAADFGLPRVRASDLKVEGPGHSASRIVAAIRGEDEAARDVILANAAAALRVSGRVATLSQGVELARAAIESGAVAELLERWRKLTTPAGLDREYAI